MTPYLCATAMNEGGEREKKKKQTRQVDARDRGERGLHRGVDYLLVLSDALACDSEKVFSSMSVSEERRESRLRRGKKYEQTRPCIRAEPDRVERSWGRKELCDSGNSRVTDLVACMFSEVE